MCDPLKDTCTEYPSGSLERLGHRTVERIYRESKEPVMNASGKHHREPTCLLAGSALHLLA